ncbi:MAG: hypothetical protein AAF357_07045, partial [Verrucomicrobiota bacterium]
MKEIVILFTLWSLAAAASAQGEKSPQTISRKPGSLNEAGNSDWADQMLNLRPEVETRLEAAKKQGLIEIAPANLPLPSTGDCNHYGWPIATMTNDTIIVMHRRIPGHNATGAGTPDTSMS